MKFFINLSLSLWFMLSVVSAQIESFPPAKIIGHWTGKGKIIVSWCRQDSLPVDMEIHKDGTVSGTIGDAPIRKGQFRLNSGFLRFLGNSTYLVEADLEGALVAGENISRNHITLFLDFKNGLLSGGFHSSGQEAGGKERMKLSGSGLVLVKGKK